MIERRSLTPGWWGVTLPAGCWDGSRLRLPVLGKALDLAPPPDAVRDLPATSEVMLLVGERVTYALTLPGQPPAPVVGSELLRLLGPAPVPGDSAAAAEPPPSFLSAVAGVLIEGRYAPLPHQLRAAWFKATHHRGFDLSTMRTGKTGSTMLALAYLLRTGQVGRVLVLAPLSCVRPVWADALAATLPGITAVAVTGTRAQKLAALRRPAEIFITNYESVSLLYQEWKAWRPDCLVIDECTHYANAASRRTKVVRALIQACGIHFVWGLTGTPGHDPVKAFAMSKTINPAAVRVKSEAAWRDLTMLRWGPQAWQWRNRETAPALIRQALAPAVLFRKDELFGLPPVMHTARAAALSPEQGRLLTALRADMLALTEDGDQVTARQRSALVGKLMQVAQGVVYNDDGARVELPCEDRLRVILELIAEAERKVVIFGAFTGPLRRLRRELAAHGIAAALVDGGTGERERGRIFHDFQALPKGNGLDVLVAHPRTTAFGVELAAADLMIFDGAPLSGDFVFGQAVERLGSLKQTSDHITVAQVYACPEERRLYKSLLEGRSESDAVAALFAEM